MFRCVSFLLYSLQQLIYVLSEDIKTKIIQHNIQYLVISAEVDSIWLKKLLNSVSTITVVFEMCSIETQICLSESDYLQPGNPKSIS